MFVQQFKLNDELEVMKSISLNSCHRCWAEWFPIALMQISRRYTWIQDCSGVFYNNAIQHCSVRVCLIQSCLQDYHLRFLGNFSTVFSLHNTCLRLSCVPLRYERQAWEILYNHDNSASSNENLQLNGHNQATPVPCPGMWDVRFQNPVSSRMISTTSVGPC